MPRKHYVAMAGMNGCFPQIILGRLTEAQAIAGLHEWHNLTDAHRHKLASGQQVSLDLVRNGNEYAVVRSCECEEGPEVHRQLPRGHNIAVGGHFSKMSAIRAAGKHNIDIRIDSVVARQGRQD